MSLRITGATALRVLRQLRHDPRTVALIVLVPCLLMALLKYVFLDSPVFDRIGGPLVGLFPLVSMFLVTSITMLRERTTGTLERLMTMPLSKLDLLLGYAAAFGLVAVAQAGVVSALSFGLLGLDVEGAGWAVIGLAVLNALLGMALGLFVSAFARSEFQAVQFMPAFILPQILLCGLLAPRDEMAQLLYAISWALPITYAYGALDLVTRAIYDAELAAYVLALCGFIVAALVAGAATLRRRTA
ncbi:MAG TPA: ABC transporter permease [Gaiellaceae bacterium]|nr:ABC transporter permease [Gaiellaceae bacterium]